MRGLRTGTRVLALLALTLTSAACAAAVGAAAGAAGAIAYSERNASTEVAGTVTQAMAATEAALDQMGITINFRQANDPATEGEIRGQDGENNITVELERESASTVEIVVTAREGELGYDPDRAGEILRNIVNRM